VVVLQKAPHRRVAGARACGARPFGGRRPCGAAPGTLFFVGGRTVPETPTSHRGGPPEAEAPAAARARGAYPDFQYWGTAARLLPHSLRYDRSPKCSPKSQLVRPCLFGQRARTGFTRGDQPGRRVAAMRVGSTPHGRQLAYGGTTCSATTHPQPCVSPRREDLWGIYSASHACHSMRRRFNLAMVMPSNLVCNPISPGALSGPRDWY